VTYALVCGAVFVLRRRHPDEPPGFRLPGAGFVAPLGALLCVYLIVTRPLHQAWVVAALLAAGALLWAAMRQRKMTA
jgi:APA family basic amino acid/polyamine antiporter